MTIIQPIRAAGILLCVGAAPTINEFLLMQHVDRWDLPKGHCDDGETFEQAARRELTEETGIECDAYQIDPAFTFDLRYEVKKKRYGKYPVQKHVRYFLAWTDRPHSIVLTEHIGHRWTAWNPPHDIQPETIDPLLSAVQEFLQGS